MELDDGSLDSLVQFSPPFKKRKTLKNDLDSDTSDDDRKETVREQRIRLQKEDEDEICQRLLKRGKDMMRRHEEAKQVSSRKYKGTPTYLFGDSDDDSNSPVSLAVLPQRWVENVNLPWGAKRPPSPDVIANDEESDGDYY
jgi:hypothetical protein